MNIIHIALLPLVLIITIILNACVTTTATSQSTRSEAVDAQPTEKKISLRALIKRYEKQAKSATIPADRQYYLLLAAETLMDHNRSDIAKRRYMAAINETQMEANHQQRLLILQAELDAKDGLYPIALQKLPKKILDFPPKVQARILKIRAVAFSKLGYLVNSIETRIQLSTRLSSLKSIEENNSTIWSLLNTLPESELRDLLKKRGNTGLKAWVQLVIGFRQAANQEARQAFLDKWYKHYPAHPASDSFIDTLRDASNLPQYPKNIAILLPLSSNNQALASVAEAVRDGFLAGHYNQTFSSKPSIKIYDVGNNPDEILKHHQLAESEGADFIVGPLNKKAVTNLSNMGKLNIPLLALNYSINSNISTKNIFQFGLLPEDEARQIAEIAIINKQTRAIILTPRSSMGKRLQTAFSEHYQQLGGKILSTEFYAPNAKDHSASIQRGLNLLQSKTRNSLLSSTINRKIKFDPRRRQDIDIVFLVANPTQARIIKPMLAYYNASDIPAYTTSMAFNGTTNTRQDGDLNGLFFVDQPWILKSSKNETYHALKKYWPRKIQMNARHYALGIDAYRIIPYLNALKLNPLERFSGYTGSISIDSQNRMHRELIWAQFEKGAPKVMELLALEDD